MVAQQRMIAAGLVVKPVPDEFLLSWTERTAQDGENDLEAIWQNLLISASHAYQRRMKSFPAILAELNGEDARFLESICPRSQVYDERQVTFAINGNLQAVHTAFGSGSGTDIDFAGVKLALDIAICRSRVVRVSKSASQEKAVILLPRATEAFQPLSVSSFATACSKHPRSKSGRAGSGAM